MTGGKAKKTGTVLARAQLPCSTVGTIVGAGAVQDRQTTLLGKATYPGEVKWNFDGIFLFDKAGGVVSRHSIKAPPTAAQISALL